MSSTSNNNIESIRHRVWKGEETAKRGKKRKCTGGLFFDFRLKSWKTFKKYIDEAINEANGTLDEVHILASETQWRKIIADGEGGGKPKWWSELNSLLDKVEKKLSDLFSVSSEKVTELHRKIDLRVHHSKTKIKYGIFPCQDTILPLYFEQSYNRNLEVEFVTFNNWNEGLKAFQSKSNPIHVALHNFPTTVAFNSLIGSEHPLFFYPFFSFNGYGIFVKREAIKKIAKKFKQSVTSTFAQLSEEAKKDLFETNKILVERNTDFEWAVMSFCNSVNCNKDKIVSNFINCNTNEAKGKFLDRKIKTYNIYCTNPINIFDLKRNAPKNFIELISHDEGVAEHHNFNGLICTIDFLNKNGEAVAELIATWFNDIVRLKKELKNARTATSSKHNKILPTLTEFLKQQIPSQIILDDLLNVYEGHNTFYETPKEAFNKFYQEVMKTDNKIFQNSKEISLIQLGKKEDTDNEVLRVMNLIKNHMSSL